MSKKQIKFQQESHKYSPINWNRKSSRNADGFDNNWENILNLWLGIMVRKLICEKAYKTLKKISTRDELFIQLEETHQTYLTKYDFLKLSELEKTYKNHNKPDFSIFNQHQGVESEQGNPVNSIFHRLREGYNFQDWSRWAFNLEQDAKLLDSTYTKLFLSQKKNFGFESGFDFRKKNSEMYRKYDHWKKINNKA